MGISKSWYVVCDVCNKAHGPFNNEKETVAYVDADQNYLSIVRRHGLYLVCSTDCGRQLMDRLDQEEKTIVEMNERSNEYWAKQKEKQKVATDKHREEAWIIASGTDCPVCGVPAGERCIDQGKLHRYGSKFNTKWPHVDRVTIGKAVDQASKNV